MPTFIPARGPWIPERSATRLREADLNVLSKLGKQGLEWRLEPEAYAVAPKTPVDPGRGPVTLLSVPEGRSVAEAEPQPADIQKLL